MATGKPSESEEEYFARKDIERLKALAAERRAKAEAEAIEQRKQLHYMHCPKCGDKLNEISYKQIKVDKCPSCDGIWLDAGELEQVIAGEDTRLMKKILRVFK